MNIDLKGKVAVVSGGATLIGKAVVQALVSAGAHVAILDIDAKGKALAKDDHLNLSAAKILRKAIQ